MDNSRDESIDLVNTDSQPETMSRNRISIVGNIRIGGVNFQRRTAEGSRLLRENFHTVMEEIRPLVEQARTVNQTVQTGISLSSLLSRQSGRNDVAGSSTRDSYVINLDDQPQPTHVHVHNHSDNVREAHATIEQPNAQNPANNNNEMMPEEASSAAEALRQVPEARALIDLLQKYIPFVLILFAKGLYDHREGIFNFVILFSCFCHSNSVVKREAAKQGRRSLSSLLIEIFYIVGCILLISLIFVDANLLSNLVFIPPYTQPLNVWDLLWIVGITDFFLKLFTIFLKILVVALPGSIIAYQKRVSIVRGSKLSIVCLKNVYVQRVVTNTQCEFSAPLDRAQYPTK